MKPHMYIELNGYHITQFKNLYLIKYINATRALAFTYTLDEAISFVKGAKCI